MRIMWGIKHTHTACSFTNTSCGVQTLPKWGFGICLVLWWNLRFNFYFLKTRTQTTLMSQEKLDKKWFCSTNASCWRKFSVNNHCPIATAVWNRSQSRQLHRMTRTHSVKRSSPWLASGGRFRKKCFWNEMQEGETDLRGPTYVSF